MQKVAAYLLERRDNVEAGSVRRAEVRRLLNVLREWLHSKGATERSTGEGTFDSRDGEAFYRWENAVAGNRSWDLLRLEEITREGRRFCTAISITDTGTKIAVYVSLEVGLVNSEISPLLVQPKCPKVIRQLLTLDGLWYHGTTKFQKLQRVCGEESGRLVAQEILEPERTLPVLVLSEDCNEVLIPKLDEHFAHDLAGLANIYVLDHAAAWGVTNVLGKPWACYWGAIRLYWPRVSREQNPYYHPIWTANTLLRHDGNDLQAAGERIRRQLRSLLMDVAAVSVVRPREIDIIRSDASKRHIDELASHAASGNEFKQLAELYAADNASLRLRNDQLNEEISTLQSALRISQQNTEAISRYQKQHAMEIEPDSSPDDDQDSPQKDEVRFYKKTGNNGRYDILERTTDCGHKKWQSATKADQARRGIAHHEGRQDWKTLWHCGTCQGGGMWKVRW